MEATNGLVAGRYRLVRLVGQGGMGAVWEGRDERLHRDVALKLLHRHQGLPDAEADQLANRAMREARLAARLEHRHAVSIYDVVEYQGQPCLVLQFVPSQTLEEILRELTTLREHEAATLGAQVASALAAAHAVGVVHRDVKPANILVSDDGTARISDFGIAHAFGETTLTSTGMLSGTPAYLAPEVARGGQSGYAADVFSLGATLYAALEGRPPFGQEPNAMGLLHKVAAGRIDPPQHPGALTPLLTEMLAPDPQSRPSMAEVADDLDRFSVADRLPRTAAAGPGPGQEAATSELVQDPAEPGAPARTRRRRALLPAIALLVVGALVLALMVLFRPGTGEPVSDPSTSATSSGASATPAVPAPFPAESTTPSTPSTSSPPRVASTPSAASSLPSPTAVTRPPTAAQLAGAISGYYGLMPRNLDQAWPLLTANYQTRVAGGRASYDRFWGGFSSVTATEVTGSPASTATALITYTTKDGRVMRERTTFGLVDEGGVLKIGATMVTSRSG
ncbi:MAG: serine/threonine-protein kinase [Lapillicoccus sp.]